MNVWRSVAAMAMAGALLAACTPRKESTLPTPTTTLPTVFPTSTPSSPAAAPTQASTAVQVKGPTKPKGSLCVKGTVRTASG